MPLRYMNGAQSEKLVLSFIPHCVEKREILSHKKKIRQINSLVTYLVKPLLSRNFCQKIVRVNSRNFHTVALRTFFLQNFREINVFSTSRLH